MMVKEKIITLVKIATIIAITAIIVKTLKTFKNKIATLVTKAFKKDSIISFNKRDKFVQINNDITYS